MEITGIICEFNPLHNGHKFLIDKTRALFPNNAVALVMSGNVVQRGELASFDKSIRAKWAIEAGADIVFELPAVFANSFAMQFARGGVFMLSQIPRITSLVFGSECGDIEALSRNLKSMDIENADENVKKAVKSQLEQGNSYPKSLANAFKNINNDDEIFLSPNNILAVEYLRAMDFFNAKLTPYTIKRQQSCDYISASQIRSLINSNSLNGDADFADKSIKFEDVKDFVPQFVFENLDQHTNATQANDILFALLKNKILSCDSDFCDISEVTEGVQNRFIKGIEKANCFSDYINFVKSKRYTMSKIKRIILSIMLDKTKFDDISSFADIDYIKVLAIHADKKQLLSMQSNLKFISKTSDLKAVSKSAEKFLKMDKRADDLFCVCNKISTSRICTHKMQVVQ